MEHEMDMQWKTRFSTDLEGILGPIVEQEMRCPVVCHVTAPCDNHCPPVLEYYIVAAGTQVISKTAKNMISPWRGVPSCCFTPIRMATAATESSCTRSPYTVQSMGSSVER